MIHANLHNSFHLQIIAFDIDNLQCTTEFNREICKHTQHTYNHTYNTVQLGHTCIGYQITFIS